MRTVYLPNAALIPVIKSIIKEGRTATFRVRGFSMRPFLEDGRDQVILTPVQSHIMKKGDVVLAEVYPNHYVLHRIANVKDEKLTLRGDGNVWGTEECNKSNVIGYARCFIRGRKGKLFETTGLQWRIYSWLWPNTPFLRRLLLAFYRRFILQLFIQKRIQSTSSGA